MRFAALLCAFWVAASGAPLAAGTWGGAHVVLEISAAGAELEFECARGRIDAPLRPDAKGNFAVSGTYTPEHAGPVLRDEDELAAARYTGHVKGASMTLTVVLKESKLGPFSLTREARTVLKKCR